MKAILARIAIAALLLGGGFLAGALNGYWYARADAAEERTEAVMDAQAEAEARLLESLERANVRARAHLDRIADLRGKLRERERAVERYAESEAGAEICLDPEGVDAWNAL